MRSIRVAGCLLLCVVALLAPGCRSFDTSIKPLLGEAPPPGYTPPLYVKGTKAIAQADASKMTMQVWRLDSDPYPDSIRLFVRVLDDQGNLITNLAPPYYKGEGDYRSVWSGLSEQLGDSGQVFPIRDFSVREFNEQDGIPFEIALALDYSGTMGSTVGAVQDAAVAFINLKRPQDRISVVKFDREARVIVPPTSSQSELVSNFRQEGLQGYGTYTALYSAAKLASSQAVDAPADHPRALIIFTDGEDNASSTTALELYKYNKEHDVPIFTVGFGAVNREVLGDLSSYTGGRFYQTYTAAELRSAFEDIYRSLRNYYLISYKPPRVVGKHIVSVSMSPPGAGDRKIAATGTYNTILTEGDGPVGDKVELNDNDLHFGYNMAVLGPDADPAIDAIAAYLRERPRMKIMIQGHTDSQGTEEYNQKLSEARAEAVRQALLARGIEPGRVQARGLGMLHPKVSNATEEGRAINRRTELKVLVR